MASTYSPSSFWWPTTEVRRAEKRKGTGSIQCDECGERFRPWRIRQVVAGASVSSAGDAATHSFCDGCHPLVFAEASHDKYPALFERTIEPTSEMYEWQTANELAVLFGLPSGKTLSGMLRTRNTVFGLEIESYMHDRVKRYRVVGKRFGMEET